MSEPKKNAERTRQVRTLLVLAVGAILLAIVRARAHVVFPARWWRLW